MNTILLIGGNGQLGRELRRTLPSLGEVMTCDRQTLDLTQPEAVQQTILDLKPQLVVNAAAYTAVDRAESEADLAYAVNAIAPTQMARAAQMLGIPLIHVSTDYVFDGRNHTPYSETDPTGPISVYGASKLAGEWGIRQACDRHLLVRTAWVYGTQGASNFVKTMLRLGGSREELRVVSDQIGTPTWAADLAQAITTAASHCLSAVEPHSMDASFWGTYHFTNSGVASWYDFAVAILEIAREIGFPLQSRRVIPISTDQYPTPAKRPAYSVLSLQKITALLGQTPCHWRYALQKMLVELYTITQSTDPEGTS